MAIKPASRKLRLLIADDNPDAIRLLTLLLQQAGHTVISAASGREALARLEKESVDMILLDVMMPDMDGFAVLETVRKTSTAPILMLSALSEPAAVERGFELGADDYIVKPFSSQQLFTRLNRLTSLLRPLEESTAVAVGRFSLDVETNLLRKDGVPIELTSIEARILDRLLKSPGRAIFVSELFRVGWGREPDLVNIAMGKLREKLEDDPDYPRHLTTVRGVGYRFDPE